MPITDALHEALREDPQQLKKIAQNAVKKAAKDIRWFDEVRNTLQGRPVQQHSGPEGAAIPVSIEGIDEAIVKLVAEIEGNK